MVSFHLTEPDSTFLSLLAMPPLRRALHAGRNGAVRGHVAPRAARTLPARGWGMAARDQPLRLVRHDGYFRPELPYLDAVEWTFGVQHLAQRFRFEDGDLDLIRDLTQADLTRLLADDHGGNLRGGRSRYVYFRRIDEYEKTTFDNIEIRRAVASAIDREHYRVLKPANMTPLSQVIPASIPGYDPAFQGQRYDYAAALEHMRRARYRSFAIQRRASGGWPSPVGYRPLRSGRWSSTGAGPRAGLAKIGIRLDLKVVRCQAFLAMRTDPERAGMSLGSWSMDYPDPSTFFEPLFGSASLAGEATARRFIRTPARRGSSARPRRGSDRASRARLYRDANAIVCGDAYMGLCTFGFHWFEFHQPYVRRFRSTPRMGTRREPRLARSRAKGGRTMRRFVRRLGWSLAVVWAVVSIAFVVNTLLPGDPARMVAGPQARPADVARIASQLGLGRPPLIQYGLFWRRLVHVGPRVLGDRDVDADHSTCAPLAAVGRWAVHLDFGKSFQLRQPVVDVVVARLPRTFALAVAGIFVQLLLGVGTGVAAAVLPRLVARQAPGWRESSRRRAPQRSSCAILALQYVLCV